MIDLDAARRSLPAFAELIGRPMADFQAEALRLETRTTVIVAPRQSGKSRSLALLALHRAFTKPGLRVLIVSAGDDAAKRLLAEIRNVAVSSPLLRGSVTDELAALVTLTNGSEIRSVPASERQIRGWTVDLLLVDEAALVSDDLLLGAAIPTTAARPDARIVLASSATSASGAFYDQAQLGLQGSPHVRTFSWALTDCLWISSATIEAARESMTPTRFAAEYEGQFASGADALFPRALLERVTAPYTMPGLHGLGRNAGLGGVDWGATTDRTTLVTVSRAVAPAGIYAVTCAHAWRSGEALDGPGGIIGQVAECPASWEQVSTETNGLGFPLSQALARRLQERPGGPRVHFVTTSQDSKAAGYSTIRMLFEQGRLVLPASAPELFRELLLLRVQITQGGGERIEAGVGHDDLADGLYLATGPYLVDGRWRTRLGDAAEKPIQVTDIEIEGETVTTGGGLVLPRDLGLVQAGGERYGPPTTAPSPWSPGAYRRKDSGPRKVWASGRGDVAQPHPTDPSAPRPLSIGELRRRNEQRRPMARQKGRP